ncbi:hypothetical protein [Kitasatospora griseola]|uniref:hypothetical protein n=1 Tax=Kitasatospora griseola TaxID=2064 RepID=UPI000697952F|nr:hypothetical protein [Kitasatospora griseola]
MEQPALCLAPPHLLPPSLQALRSAEPGSTPCTGALHEPLADSQEADYDAFFGIVRCGEAPAARLLVALERTLATLLPLTDGTAAGRFERAMRSLGRPLPAPAGDALTAEAGPQARWIHGHRLFLTLTQAAVVGLQHAAAAPAPCAADGVEVATAFLRASSAALRLTASFTRDDYRRTVRPSMAPPQCPAPGFSGLWSADHRALVDRLRRWGETPAVPGDGRRRADPALQAALDEVYRSHIGVCARFVGTAPSLLGGADDSLATLGRLARARRNLLNAPGRPPGGRNRHRR